MSNPIVFNHGWTRINTDGIVSENGSITFVLYDYAGRQTGKLASKSAYDFKFTELAKMLIEGRDLFDFQPAHHNE